jgi:hypothetical protein
MPGIDSPWTAEVAGSGATADVLAGVLDMLTGERDEHPAVALTNTQPTAIATRTGCVFTNDIPLLLPDMDRPAKRPQPLR